MDKYVDELATIGTLAHYMIECHCKGVEPDLGDYTKNQIALAENSYLKWMFWQDQVGFVPEHNELELISSEYRFGGTIDIIQHGIRRTEGHETGYVIMPRQLPEPGSVDAEDRSHDQAVGAARQRRSSCRPCR